MTRLRLASGITAWGAQADVANFQPHPLDYYVLTAELALGS